MLRGLFTLLSVLSLLLCSGLVWLDRREGRGLGGGHDLFSIYRKSWRARYTLRANATHVILQGPPELSGAAPIGQPSAAALVAQMDDSKILWRVTGYSVPDSMEFSGSTRGIEASDRTYQQLLRTSDEDCFRAMLYAMEDPNKAFFAHCVLAQLPQFRE